MLPRQFQTKLVDDSSNLTKGVLMIAMILTTRLSAKPLFGLRSATRSDKIAENQ